MLPLINHHLLINVSILYIFLPCDDSVGGKNTDYPNKEGPFGEGIHPTHHPDSPTDSTSGSDNVLIMNTANEDRTTSFFAQPGILAGKYYHNYHYFLLIRYIFPLFY